MKLSIRIPDVPKEVRRAQDRYRSDLRRAAVIATDRAARDAQQDIKIKIRSVDLGRLGGAVAFTSTKRRGQADGRDPYGVIYAKGGDESLAGGALESYTRGATIRANQKQWLAFQTNAIPRRIGRYRTTPERYRGSGLETSIGPLVFKPLGPNKALLVIKNVTLSPKNGRAKRAGKRAPRTRIAVKEVVAFILIRVTRRAQRFDKDAIVFRRAAMMPDYLADALDAIEGARGG